MAGRENLSEQGPVSWTPEQDHPLEDWYDDEYGGWSDPEPEPPARPWSRNPGVLIGLIAAAAVALIVATVLLMAGRLGGGGDGDGDDPLRIPRLTPRTTPTAPPTPPPSPPPTTAPTQQTETMPATAGPPPAAESTGQAVGEDPEPAPEPEPAAPAPQDVDEPAEGPRTNVTRSPMSFTPPARG